MINPDSGSEFGSETGNLFRNDKLIHLKDQFGNVIRSLRTDPSKEMVSENSFLWQRNLAEHNSGLVKITRTHEWVKMAINDETFLLTLHCASEDTNEKNSVYESQVRKREWTFELKPDGDIEITDAKQEETGPIGKGSANPKLQIPTLDSSKKTSTATNREKNQVEISKIRDKSVKVRVYQHAIKLLNNIVANINDEPKERLEMINQRF